MIKIQDVTNELGLLVQEDLMDYPFVREGVQKLPYSFAKENHILPLEEKEECFLVGLRDLLNQEILQEVQLYLNKEIKPILCSQSALDQALEACYGVKKDHKTLFSKEKSEKVSKKDEGVEDYDLLEIDKTDPIVRLLNRIILEAIQQGSSDIHFEPKEKHILIRYRIDGVLLDRYTPPIDYLPQMVTRIKVMAHLDIAEKRLPQDGRIKLQVGKREIDFRVSSIPVVYGERIVLRILDRENLVLGLDKLGMSSSLLKNIKELSHFTEGILLATGPTGSGKTTTLYSVMSQLNSNEMNIMTIEDPVEYKLPNISQIAVNPLIDLTFSKGLRHILRQDPDVIMIGEIRDKETATIAIQAALTGHLVLSTLHTNDAPSALTRLADMGIEPYLLSSTIIGVIAQRLVRKICPKCKFSYLANHGNVEQQKQQLPADIFYKGKGCAHCFGTGYKGRQGIYEIMKVTPKVKQQIMKKIDSFALKQLALEENMQDLFSNGKKLVQQGNTTYEEVLRVTRTIN